MSALCRALKITSEYEDVAIEIFNFEIPHPVRRVFNGSPDRCAALLDQMKIVVELIAEEVNVA